MDSVTGVESGDMDYDRKYDNTAKESGRPNPPVGACMMGV